MRHPGYLLNPGDMFQVDPERVMFATGAPKNKYDRREARLEKKLAAKAEAEAAEKAAEEAAEEAKENEATPESETKEAEPLDTRKTLQQMISHAKNIMSDNKTVMAGKRKQELRGFQKAVRRVMSRSSITETQAGNLEAQFSEILTLLNAKQASRRDTQDKKATEDDAKAASESKDTEGPETTETKAAEVEATKDAEASELAEATEGTAAAANEDKPTDALTEAFRQATLNPDEKVDVSELTWTEIDVLKRALVQMRDNPVDSSKPYATPWRPRDYMNAFAFIPRYLEVNQNICAAVYVRHPVARPGFSEVPTPFSEEVSTGAYHWYLRRR
jgi:ribosomal protein S4